MTNTIEKITVNGIEKFNTESWLEHDFHEAQRILDLGDYTQDIDAEYAYNERPVGLSGFLGTYRVMVERDRDYHRFCMMVGEEFMRGDAERYKPTFEEWKTGKTEQGMKLGKALRKKGFSQELLDFYSAQIKTERAFFLTVSDAPQHIAGMSYYSPGNWNGMSGKSCQSPEIGGDLAVHLGGSLHDDCLLVGMLHESLEDLQDMEDKLIARVVFRAVEIDDRWCLIPTQYYGNNETKGALHSVLVNMEQVFDIYSNEITDYNEHTAMVSQRANGAYTMYRVDSVTVYEDIDTTVEVECPLCDGHGTYSTYTDRSERYVEIACPACEGTGEIDVEVCMEVEHDEEVEDEEEVLPYVEGYSHYGNEVVVRVDMKRLSELQEGRESLPYSVEMVELG